VKNAHDYVIDGEDGRYRFLCRCGAACAWTTAQLAKEEHAAHKARAEFERGHAIATSYMNRAATS
jgi:hypothetical protein